MSLPDVSPWFSTIKDTKKLTVCATPKLKANANWLNSFTAAVAEFNRLSANLKLGVTFDFSSGLAPPDLNSDAGANVLADLGNGALSWYLDGKTHPVTHTDPTTQQEVPTNFSPTDLHGLTVAPRRGGSILRAFLFLPETPMIDAPVGPPGGTRPKQLRAVGSGIRLYIAVHELIHACGIHEKEHSPLGRDKDVFTSPVFNSAGEFSRPEDDRMEVADSPAVLSPPIKISKRVADLIRGNWV